MSSPHVSPETHDFANEQEWTKNSKTASAHNMHALCVI